MNSILDVPEIRASVHRWTVADFRALAELRKGRVGRLTARQGAVCALKAPSPNG